MRRHPLSACLLTVLVLISLRSVRAAEQSAQVTAATVLTQWAAASRFLSPLTPQSAVEKFKQQNQAYFTGHELALISEFQQPVSVEELQETYHWQIIRQSQARIVLRGQPRDPLTQRLCRPFELHINPRSMLPESLSFQTNSARQSQRFASIELTALKVAPTTARVQTYPQPEFVSQTVAKSVFSQIQTGPVRQSPIQRVAFARLSSGENNQTEQLEIERLVARWITESKRIDYITSGDGSTIVKRNPQDRTLAPGWKGHPADGSLDSEQRAFLQTLPGWLIDVDQKQFLIESFSIELSMEATETVPTRYITLQLKPHPDQPHPGWERIELEFSSRQALPIRISETRNDHIFQFLLSDLQIHYAK